MAFIGFEWLKDRLVDRCKVGIENCLKRGNNKWIYLEI